MTLQSTTSTIPATAPPSARAGGLTPAENTGAPLVAFGYARTAERHGWEATVESVRPSGYKIGR